MHDLRSDAEAAGAVLHDVRRRRSAREAHLPLVQPGASRGRQILHGVRGDRRRGGTVGGPMSAAPTQASAPATTPPSPPKPAAITIFARLGVGGVLMLVAGILMIVSVTKPWFNVEGLGTLAWNEGYVWSTGYETFAPSSPISADIGYFAVILGAASVFLGVLNVCDVAPDWEGKLDKAWLKVFGRFFADRGACLLVLAAIIARFATRQDESAYAIGIYIFLVAAILLTIGSIVARTEMTARAQTALAT